MSIEFKSVTAFALANLYFEGKVVSHTVVLEGGEKKTFGIIYPGTYSFNTGAPELMEITAGVARYRLANESEWSVRTAGESFAIAGESSFEIEVSEITQYICSFLK